MLQHLEQRNGVDLRLQRVLLRADSAVGDGMDRVDSINWLRRYWRECIRTKRARQRPRCAAGCTEGGAVAIDLILNMRFDGAQLTDWLRTGQR